MGLSLADEPLLKSPVALAEETRLLIGLPIWLRLFRLGLLILAPVGLVVALVFGVRHVTRLPRAVLKGHAGGVMSVAFSPDGARLASGSQDGEIRLWDLNGERHLVFNGHGARVSSLCFSPMGRFLASGSFDHTIRIWDLDDLGGRGDPDERREFRTIRPDWGQVQAVAFSPDGRLVAAAIDGSLPSEQVSPDHSAWDYHSIVGVWDVLTGEEVARLKGGTGWFISVAFSPDGRSLAAGPRQPVMPTAPDDAWIWDTATWRQDRLLPQRAGVLSVAFTPDSRRLAIAGWARTVRLFDLQNTRETVTFGPHGRWITSVAVSPDGRLLASASNDQTIRVWDVAGESEQTRVHAHDGWVMAVAFAPDGRRIASAGQDGLVKLWAVGDAGGLAALNWLQNPMFWAWVGFHIFIILMLAVDLGLFQRKAHVMSTREAAGWYAVWVTCAVLFGLGVWHFQGNQKGVEFAAGYLIEQSLSVDNLFVFIVIFRYFAVPAHLQHRVLFWGIIGALVMRAGFILLGAELLTHFHFTLYFFGALLIYTAWKLLWAGDHQVHPEKNILLRLATKVFPVVPSYESNRFWARINGRLHITPLFLVLLVIESTDVVFAVDSIPAILAVFEDPKKPDIFIAYTSNIFAILGLRSLFFLLAGFLGMFRFLNIGLALVLSFVGVKMLLAAADIYKIDSLMSLAVIASILAVSIIASIIASSGKKGGEAAPALPPPPPPSVDGQGTPSPSAEPQHPHDAS